MVLEWGTFQRWLPDLRNEWYTERGDTGEDELEGEGFNLDGKLLEGRNCYQAFALCVGKIQWWYKVNESYIYKNLF